MRGSSICRLFFQSHMPFYANVKMSEGMQMAIFFFGMSNAMVNPFIYGAFHLWQPNDGRRRRIPNSFSTGLTWVEPAIRNLWKEWLIRSVSRSESGRGGFVRRGGVHQRRSDVNAENLSRRTGTRGCQVNHGDHKRCFILHRHPLSGREVQDDFSSRL